MSQAPRSERLFIDGPAGRLEALLEMPPDAVEPAALAVVCHPHPQHQGTMLNKVAHTLARSFVQLGAPALRFNFRGVGRSEGEFANAVGEVDDAIAALDYMHDRWPTAALWLGGFSFGAQVSLSAATQRDIAWLVTVAPPVERMQLEEFRVPDCPWLLVQGGADEVVDPDGVADWAKSLDPAPDFEWLPGVGHFFHGHLNALRDIVMAHVPQRGRNLTEQ